jgi:hypothetical protein
MSGSSNGPKRPKPKWIDQTTFYTGYQTIPKNGPIVGTKSKDKALETNQPKPVRTIVLVFRKDTARKRQAVIQRRQPPENSYYPKTTAVQRQQFPKDNGAYP